MTPDSYAWIAGATVTILSSLLLSVDRVLDAFLRSWVRWRYYLYRFWMVVIHVVGFSIVAGVGLSIGWEPAPDASGFEASVHGLGWSLTAVALLRADFGGLRSSETAPGFSLLRNLSNQLIRDVEFEARHAIESTLAKVVDVDELARVAFSCIRRAFPPRVDGENGHVVMTSLQVTVGEYHRGAQAGVEHSLIDMRALVRELIDSYRIDARSIKL